MRDIQRKKEQHIRQTLKQMSHSNDLDGVTSRDFSPRNQKPILPIQTLAARPNTMASFLNDMSSTRQQTAANSQNPNCHASPPTLNSQIYNKYAAAAFTPLSKTPEMVLGAPGGGFSGREGEQERAGMSR